ncbi:MAG: transcription antitermination factor NusB [Pseudomonadota bacterium]|nr:transcription antitermination factor NusB [Pseudomonadota bacterium]MED5429771.1 transcription antitermination factor NusB [Pseudomonadota bacterium]|tara:strand:- start:316 stop:720 length:405 start_codon:yes stop_codon:yes gene_type:complete
MNNKERTLARENIVKILYQKDISKNDLSSIIGTFVEKRKFDNRYFDDLIKLLDINLDEIDNYIIKNSNLSELESTIIDKSILRLSVCEFLYRKDIPKKVILDESIKIAKKYSSEKSFKFINKILDQLLLCNHDN